MDDNACLSHTLRLTFSEAYYGLIDQSFLVETNSIDQTQNNRTSGSLAATREVGQQRPGEEDSGLPRVAPRQGARCTRMKHTIH